MQSKLIAQPADCALVEMLFVKTSVIQIRFRLSAAHEGAKQSSRGDDEPGAPPSQIENPRRIIVPAATADLPGRDFRFAGPVGFVIRGDVVKVVQSGRGHAGRAVRKIKW